MRSSNLPGNKGVDSLQKHLPTGLSLLVLVLQVGKGWLLRHARSPRCWLASVCHNYSIIQSFPRRNIETPEAADPRGDMRKCTCRIPCHRPLPRSTDYRCSVELQPVRVRAATHRRKCGAGPMFVRRRLRMGLRASNPDRPEGRGEFLWVRLPNPQMRTSQRNVRSRA